MNKVEKLFPKVKSNVDIKPFTSFGVGGKVRWYLRVSTPEELANAANEAKASGIPYLLMSGGSNLVFSDETYPGLLIHYINPRASIACQGATLTCDAGLTLSRLIRFAIDNNLAGLEALSGIPGTVGGAIVGNAGAYGQAISDHIEKVEIFNPTLPSPKGRVWISKKQAGFAYRHSLIKDKGWLVLRAEFNLEKGNKKELTKKSREIIKIRNAKYAPDLKSPGSYFKNVLVNKISKTALKKIDQSKIRDGKIPAGYLLEAVGAKGMRVGEAVVANFHGNLIINEGHATYADVRTLAKKLKKLVKQKFGIGLEEEVRYML
ncbi:MAG: UDP-N-acetylmuramate dehydrogenase [Patescibacteria group bacterium]